jgi:hypothetical protein
MNDPSRPCIHDLPSLHDHLPGDLPTAALASTDECPCGRTSRGETPWELRAPDPGPGPASEGSGVGWVAMLSIAGLAVALPLLAAGRLEASTPIAPATSSEASSEVGPGDLPVEDHPELRAAFDGDQADRTGSMHDMDWEAVSRRDAERRGRVRELVEAGEARTAADYYHAAMVFQHGEGIEDIRQARDWAQRGVELAGTEDPVRRRALWLFAAATDRHLHRQGEPQIYGTQFIRDPNGGPWTMEPFDREAISAEERAAHGVASIAEQEERLEAMNRELRERGLLGPVDGPAGDG